MTRFMLIINNDEAEDNGDEQTFEDIRYELGELIRSGYYELENLEFLSD